MTPTPSPEFSDLTLERYLLAELPEAMAARVAEAVRTSHDIRQRLASLSEANHILIHTGDLHRLEAAVTARDTRSATVVWRWMPAAAAITLVVAALSIVPGMTRPDADVVRVKGAAATLAVYRQVETGSETLTDGAPARAGDLLRVAYRTAAPAFGVIVSIDGAGVVTRHHPVDGSQATRLRAGDATPLDSAYELDDAPKWERFFLITSEQAFEVSVVLQAAERIAAAAPVEPPVTLGLGDGFGEATFLLRKVR